MSSATVLDRVHLDDAQPKATTRSPHSSTSPTAMSFSTSRPFSPTSPSRPNMNPDSQRSPRSSRTTTSDFFSPSRMRRASSVKPTSSKAKVLGNKPKESVDTNGGMGPTSPTHHGASDRDLLYHYTTSTSTASIEKPRPSTTEGSSTGLKRSRTSILVAASDALGLRFGRRRPSIIKHPPMPIVLPDVIEICAPRKDEEAEEREQLREMAAQSIGLGSVLMHQEIHSCDNSIHEDNEEEEELVMTTSPVDMPEPSNARGLDASLMDGPIGRSPHNSTISVSQPAPLPARYRAGSMLGHSRTNSTSLNAVPPYPTTPSALNQFKQQAATLPKYYPPSSLRIFALSKNWKNRYMILSTPTALITRGSGPAVSYLHLFKSANPDEKEVERLEINDDSVVFVAEEEVGGRRHVIKVGGLDVGAMKKDWNSEEGGRTMWFLQITDSAEAQKWISGIKTAILGQRTMRAGLGPTLNVSAGTEPRGDMDVMLSIRTQGFMSTANNPRSPTTTPPQSTPQADKTYASSISSHSVRSQATTPRPTSSAVTTLKGLFSSPGRPRASSRATSIDTDRQPGETESKDDSFGRVSQNIFSMLRPGTSPGASQAPSSSSLVAAAASSSSVPFSGTNGLMDFDHRERLDRKIVVTEDNGNTHSNWTSFDPLLPADISSTSRERPNRTLSLGAWSLHPPPRKRWTSASVTPITIVHSEETEGSESCKSGLYAHGDGNASTAGSFGVAVATSSSEGKQNSKETEGETEVVEGEDKIQIEPPMSPALSGFSFGTPEHKPRAASLRSVSTLASGEHGGGGVSADRSSSSTRRSSSMRRWSRQGGTLPQRPTPPTGPPPPPPTNLNGTRLQPHPPHPPPVPAPPSSSSHPYTLDRSPSRTSTRSGTSQRSLVSSLPSFSNSKRASTSSSIMSINGIGIGMNGSNNSAVTPPPQPPVNLNYSPSRSTLYRTSMPPPPPRPVPTFALPPTPAPLPPPPMSVLAPMPILASASGIQEVSKLDNIPSPIPSRKSSFRESVTQRALRLSMIAAPKPPPSSVLPPRPDETTTPTGSIHSNTRPPSIGGHRRSGSSEGSIWTTNNTSTSSLPSAISIRRKLDSIPGSPNPPAQPLNVVSPFPPPSTPLPLPPPPSRPNFPIPPRPSSSTSTSSVSSGTGISNSNAKNTTTATAIPRHNSFKHRLRILSAPSPISTDHNHNNTNTSAINSNGNGNGIHNITRTTQFSGIRTRSRGLTTTLIAPLTLTTASTTASYINPFSPASSSSPSSPSYMMMKQPFFNNTNNTHNNNNNNRTNMTTMAMMNSNMTMTTPISTSSPTTPIAERITFFQDDPSFLQLLTPTSPPLSLPPYVHGHNHGHSHSSSITSISSSLPTATSSSFSHHHQPHPLQHLHQHDLQHHQHRSHSPDILSDIPTSLSPPPRRHSKQVSFLDTDLDSPELSPPISRQDEDQKQENEHPFMMSLSRPGSVISLGIVSM
ncbi:hypothetical protein BDN72DRAFT_834469 [Pluteus cervinus]|uniref:Uncharacterized protein n=1 Tax=Pluteus cervinus TaxID=181527 RepID=A0ACD3B707_9AGAR|nr:hypothetical protein BDN72DRAFT_834469 [Pluteus cervinus]